MKKARMTTLIINLVVYSYMIYLLYFKGTTRINFILGNVLIVLGAIILALKIYFYFKTKDERNKEYEKIQELLKETSEKTDNLK